MSAVNERTYVVRGMTCGHCEASVSEAVAQVAEVTRTEADRQTGRLTVTGDGFTDEAIRTAVEAAGYEMARS